MSWIKGTEMFIEIWSIIKKNIENEEHRKVFTTELIKLFTNFDMDPMYLAGQDSELDSLIGYEGSDLSPEEGVELCISEITNLEGDKRLQGIELLARFIDATDGFKSQDAAISIMNSFGNNDSETYIKYALSTLRGLVWDYKVKINKSQIEKFILSNNPKIKELAQYIIKGLNHWENQV